MHRLNKTLGLSNASSITDVVGGLQGLLSSAGLTESIGDLLGSAGKHIASSDMRINKLNVIRRVE